MDEPEDPDEERDELEEEPKAREELELEEPAMTPLDAIYANEPEPGAMPPEGQEGVAPEQDQDQKARDPEVITDGPRDPGDRKWIRGPSFRRSL